MNNITMRPNDAVSAPMAECFITIGTNRYNFMQMISFEAKVEKKKSKIPILGQTGAGNKPNLWSGTFRGRAHYNQSILRRLLVDYKNSGEDTYFDIQVTNCDPSSAAGTQTVILTGCNLDGGTLAKFDAAGDFLDEEISGTFENFKLLKEFSQLDEMVD